MARRQRPVAPLTERGGDPKDVRIGTSIVDRRDARADADLRAVLATPEGRRFAMRVIQESQALQSVYDPAPERMYFVQGAQRIGVYLMTEIQRVDGDAFFEMWRDAAALARAEAEEAESRRAQGLTEIPEGDEE